MSAIPIEGSRMLSPNNKLTKCIDETNALHCTHGNLFN